MKYSRQSGIAQPGRIAFLSCALLLHSVAVVLGGDPSSTDQRTSNQRTSDHRGSALLRAVEQRVLPLPLVPGVARFDSLADYYWDANPGLRRRLDQGIDFYHHDHPQRFRGLTIVAGSAGVGKSFVKRHVYNQSVAREAVWKIDVHELFDGWADQGCTETKPDVEHRDAVISRLPCLTTAGQTKFIELIRSRSESFFVVDSLDEVHPDNHLFILRELERVVFQSRRDFIHVVVLGRPVAFREYWRSLQRRQGRINVQSFLLAPPDFRTTGDLLVSSYDHDNWHHQLRRVDADGTARPMSLDDYRRWHASGFALTGDFQDLRFEPNRELNVEARRRLERQLSHDRVALAVFSNLAGNSLLRAILSDHAAYQRPVDERDLMEEYFARWLERDTKSSDRPSRMKPQHLELYVRLLAAIAARYAEPELLDRMGYFEVDSRATVEVEYRDTTVSVPIQRLLNLSGLITVDPLRPDSSRYRFEPFWTHRLLLHKHHEIGAEQPLQPVAVAP